MPELQDDVEGLAKNYQLSCYSRVFRAARGHEIMKRALRRRTWLPTNQELPTDLLMWYGHACAGSLWPERKDYQITKVGPRAHQEHHTQALLA
jgi:hypothetical protein